MGRETNNAAAGTQAESLARLKAEHDARQKLEAAFGLFWEAAGSSTLADPTKPYDRARMQELLLPLRVAIAEAPPHVAREIVLKYKSRVESFPHGSLVRQDVLFVLLYKLEELELMLKE